MTEREIFNKALCEALITDAAFKAFQGCDEKFTGFRSIRFDGLKKEVSEND